MRNTVKKQAFDYELIAMSFHEAGHTICAIHNLIKVVNVNVMTLTQREGNTEYLSHESDEAIIDTELSKILLIFELQMRYAGLIAEKIYYKDICGSSKFPMHLKEGSSGDILYASSLIRKYKLVAPGRYTVLLKKQIQNDVDQLLKEHWDAVKIIAHALYKKKRLTFDELKYLLIRKTEHKEFWKDRFNKIKIIYNENKPLTQKEIKNIVLDDVLFSI